MKRPRVRKPPPALAGCKVEQYAIRTRTIKYSGHSGLFVDGNELGPVPRLAICRDKDGINLFHCDARWKVLGCSGNWANIKEAKQRAERAYPGISKVWAKTGFTSAQAKRYLEQTGHNRKCSFCGKFWHEVAAIVTARDKHVAICDRCARQVNELMTDADPDVSQPNESPYSTSIATDPVDSRRSSTGRRASDTKD